MPRTQACGRADPVLLAAAEVAGAPEGDPGDVADDAPEDVAEDGALVEFVPQPTSNTGTANSPTAANTRIEPRFTPEVLTMSPPTHFHCHSSWSIDFRVQRIRLKLQHVGGYHVANLCRSHELGVAERLD